MIGRRVATFDDIERAGDYYGPTEEVDAEGRVVGRNVWFLLPTHAGGSKFERITPASGLHRVSEPPWTFRESIACGRGSPEGEYFHGYLDEGHVWRIL
jgi:hypothetical protein